MRILVITAGGRAKKRQFGMGHIYRTLNLAEYLKKTNNIFFLLEDHDSSKEIIKKYGYDVLLLKKDLDNSTRITRVLYTISKLKIDCVIIDWNRIEKSFVKKIKKYAKTVVITDMKNKEFNADLVINGFIGFKNTIIKNKFGAKCLLGPRYQILNKKFDNKKHYKKKYNLLVTFGGYDEKNISEFILKCLKKYNKKIKTKIILGPATPKSYKIKKLEKQLGKTVSIIDKTYDMHKEMKIAEFGICSGGLTSYEFATSGTPFAIICQLNHQLLVAQEWQKRGVAKNLGVYNHKNKKKLVKIIRELPIKEKERKIRILDGHGASIVSKEIYRLLKCHRR